MHAYSETDPESENLRERRSRARESREHTENTPNQATPPAGADRLLYEIERLERELDVLRQQLAGSHRLATLGTLAAAAAHEVNNILTPIASYAQLALQHPEDAELTAKALDIAVQNSRRGGRIFAATLGFASPHPKSDDAAASADPQQALADALECLPRAPQAEGITLAIELAPARLAIDATELQQVLLNLLLNARKALGEHGNANPHIAVKGSAQSRNKYDDTAASHSYVLEVVDNGPGIPMHTAAHLFEPFVTARAGEEEPNRVAHRQGDAAASQFQKTEQDGLRNPGSGTGLGLSVCRRLIEAAHGSIRLDSEYKCGARFIITLPVVEQDASS